MSAITNLGTLKTAVQVECQRVGNTGFVTALPRMIQAAEESIYLGTANTAPIRVQFMETDADLAFVDGEASLPEDFLEQVRLFWDSDLNNVPTYVIPDEFYSRRNRASGYGLVSFYTVEGSKVLISPAATGTGKLRYYARPAAFELDTDTNWLLANASKVYFHGVCYEGFTYLRNDTKAAEHLASFTSAVGALAHANERRRTAGRRLRPWIRQARC